MTEYVTLNGNRYSDGTTDENDTVRNLANDGHRTWFFPLLQDFMVEAGRVLYTTSATSKNAGLTGSQAWVLADDRVFSVGQWVLIARTSAPTSTYYIIQVTSYVSGTKTLTGTVKRAVGTTASVTDWSVSLASEPGFQAGIPMAIDLSATADADPGSGLIRFNHGTPASATVLYIDLADADGTTITAILDAMDDSTSTTKGTLEIRSRVLPGVWLQFTVTAWTTASGYRKITVTYLAGPGGFANSEAVALTFYRTGDQGSAGSSASESAEGIAELATQAEVNAGVDDLRIVTPLKLQTKLASYIEYDNEEMIGMMLVM